MNRHVAVPLLIITGLFGPLLAALRAQPDSQPIRSQLTAREHAVISSEIAAKIDRMPLREGGTFKKGDLLVAFDDTLQQAQLKRAKAAYEAADRTLAANERLLALKSIGELEYELSKTETTKAGAELSYSEAMLAKCRILAPYAGRVAATHVRDKEFVQAGQPLLEIIDDAVPELEFIAPSAWLAWLAVGQSLTVSIDETARDYPAVIERIGARVDPVSRTIKIVATFTGQPAGLTAGMSGSIHLQPPVSTTGNP